MNWLQLAEASGSIFKLPLVTIIVLTDKYIVATIGMLYATNNKAYNNEICERALAVIFINITNIKVYSELLNTLKNDYLIIHDH